MQHTAMLEAIRGFVRAAFAQAGGQLDQGLTEHVLVRNDTYCGRRFHCQGLQGIWFIEEDQLKIYGADGRVVEVVTASQICDPVSQPNRRAA
jgi:hypothetical protein